MLLMSSWGKEGHRPGSVRIPERRRWGRRRCSRRRLASACARCWASWTRSPSAGTDRCSSCYCSSWWSSGRWIEADVRTETSSAASITHTSVNNYSTTSAPSQHYSDKSHLNSPDILRYISSLMFITTDNPLDQWSQTFWLKHPIKYFPMESKKLLDNTLNNKLSFVNIS